MIGSPVFFRKENREEKFNWVCSNDNSQMFISQKGNMRCNFQKENGDYAHFGPIITWRWNCGRHDQHKCNGYRSGDVQAFTYTLAIAGLHMKKWGAIFCGDLLKAIGEQYG